MPVVPTNEAELRLEQQKIYWRSGAAFILCSISLCTAHFLLPGIIDFPSDDLESRLVFLAAANLLLVAWVIIGVRMVSNGRRGSAEDIVGSAYSRPSPNIAVASAFLQNTLEQFVIASVTLSALLILWGAPAMPFVSVSILLFSIGRVSFLMGYPKGAGGRAFGMALTALPSVAAFLLSIGIIIVRL